MATKKVKVVAPTPEVNGRSDFQSLLLYSLYAPTWTAYRRDKKVTSEVKAANEVSDTLDVGSFNKLLLPECVELDHTKKYLGQTRQEFYLRTAPWGEARGTRAGKVEEHMDVMVWFGDKQAGLEPLKDALRAVYPSKVAAAEFQLNGMFNYEDYPDVDEVMDRFQLRLSVIPLPNVNDIRVMTEIPAHIREEIEANVTADLNKAFTASATHAFEALLKPIQHLAATLKRYDEGKAEGRKMKLYDSLVENIQVMSEMATKLNLTRDPNLEKVAAQAGKLAAMFTTDDLRDSEGLRTVATEAAENLAARIAAFMP